MNQSHVITLVCQNSRGLVFGNHDLPATEDLSERPNQRDEECEMLNIESVFALVSVQQNRNCVQLKVEWFDDD